MPVTFDDLTGRIVSGLRVQHIARRLPDLAWQCVCTKCGTVQTVRHVFLTNLSAHCANNGCQRSPVEITRASAIAVSESSRTASNAERSAFAASQPRQSQPVADSEAERRKAERDEAHRRELDSLREQHRRYYWHQLERGVTEPMSLERFAEIGDYARKRIAEIIERDETSQRNL